MARDSDAASGLILLVILGGGWLYFSGRLDPLIEAHQKSGLPADEVAFIDILLSAKHSWQNAPNEIAKEPIPGQREAALCAVPRSIMDWVGTVDYVGTYFSLKDPAPASLSVTIARNITLRTEGDLQEYGSKIQRATPLFETVSRLAAGQRAEFSGEFIKGDKTCLRETSLTNDGSLTAPEFEFIFKKVRVP